MVVRMRLSLRRHVLGVCAVVFYGSMHVINLEGNHDVECGDEDENSLIVGLVHVFVTNDMLTR